MIKGKLTLIAGAVTAVAAVSLLVSCSRREIRNIDSRGRNIICFGDSITAGHGVSPQDAYPQQLARLMGLPVINAGIDGDSTATAFQRIGTDVMDRDPLLVIIEFGGNDFMQKVSRDETVAYIGRMCDTIQAKGAMVAIVDINAGILLGEYTSAYQALAMEKGAIFIPGALLSVMTDAELKSDFVHPNGKGYKVIAHRVYRAIIPHLNRNTLLNKFRK